MQGNADLIKKHVKEGNTRCWINVVNITFAAVVFGKSWYPAVGAVPLGPADGYKWIAQQVVHRHAYCVRITRTDFDDKEEAVCNQKQYNDGHSR